MKEIRFPDSIGSAYLCRAFPLPERHELVARQRTRNAVTTRGSVQRLMPSNFRLIMAFLLAASLEFSMAFHR